MKFLLTQLNARFLAGYDPNGSCVTVATLKDAQGVAFQCPTCAIGKIHNGTEFRGVHYIICWFVGKVPDSAIPGPIRWTPSGKDLTNLTLSPPVIHQTGCYWQGSVTNGSVE